jgi:hypothetical protein
VNGVSSPSGFGSNAARIFDPTVGANGAFTVTGSLLSARDRHAAALLKTGEVLIVGGTNGTNNLNSAEVHFNGAFSAAGNMAHVRVYSRATALNDGTVLVAGGCCEVSNQHLQYAESYDPTARIFSPTSDMNEQRAAHTATLLPNGQVLIAGGFQSLTAELYRPVSPMDDNFNGTSIDPNRWHDLTLPPGFSVSVSETSQRLEITEGAGAGGGGIVS